MSGPGLRERLMELLFPPKCVFCRRVLPDGVRGLCPDCAAEMPYTQDGGRQKGGFYEFCIAPLRYEGALRESFLRYKFGGMSSYAAAFGALLADCIKAEPEAVWDELSWVPLSAERLRQRGYDQARLLAEATARELGCGAVPLLEKGRHTPAQSGLTEAEARHTNVSGAFRVPEPGRVEGRRILLIDDIVTTGATLSECARVLRYAGAERVLCAALARAREGQDAV